MKFLKSWGVKALRLLLGSNWQSSLLGLIGTGVQIPGLDVNKFVTALTGEAVLSNPDFWSGVAVILPYLIGRIARNGKPNPILGLRR